MEPQEQKYLMTYQAAGWQGAELPTFPTEQPQLSDSVSPGSPAQRS